MKVEMGESLVRTWVRHNRRCQLAELNWKPSPVWHDSISEEHEEIYQDAKIQFAEYGVLLKSSLSQFMKQGEIDVLGIRLDQGRVNKVIAVDIAFHSSGLQYGSKSETAARIIKKGIRTALIVDRYFRGCPAEILFMSPKVTPATASLIVEAESALHEFIRKWNPELSFQCLINGQFKEKVFNEVMALREEVADTSELFLRAAQLVNLFE